MNASDRVLVKRVFLALFASPHSKRLRMDRVDVFIRLPFSWLPVNILMSGNVCGWRREPYVTLLLLDESPGIRIGPGGKFENRSNDRLEVIGRLQKNGMSIVDDYVVLSDDKLERKGGMPPFGGAATTGQEAEFVFLTNAARHLKSMKAAVGDFAVRFVPGPTQMSLA
jgi:hypothetical protein